MLEICPPLHLSLPPPALLLDADKEKASPVKKKKRKATHPMPALAVLDNSLGGPRQENNQSIKKDNSQS